MATLGSWWAGRIALTTRLLVTVGVVAALAGGSLIGMTITAAAATPAIKLAVKTAPGAVCSGSTCSKLAGGDILTVTGSGFTKNELASILECNDEPSQPVILYLGNYVPISCTKIVIVATSKTGTYGPANFTLVAGTTGPPATPYTPTCVETSTGSTTTTSTIPSCTTSGNETTDAANYQCPPSAAQQAAGDTCVLAIGDILGERAVGTILFGSETLPTTTTTTKATTTTTTGSTTTTGATTTTSTTSTTTTLPTSTSTATKVSAPSVTLGPAGTVSDTVTVQGTPTNGSPSGNVSFYVCQTSTANTLTTGPCPATTHALLGVAHLSAGADNSSAASSGSFDPTASGTWCFSAVYGGDSVYTGSADNTSAANLDANECVLGTPASPTTASFISSARVTLGPTGSATDFVTVAGNVVGGPPTGSVTFYVCHTNITQTLTATPCAPSGTPEDSGVALAPGAGATSTTTSSAFSPTSVGTWCFSAVYGGSSTYAGSADNTNNSNVDASECVVVGPSSADAFTSAPNAPATAGSSFSFLVTTSGSPVPVLKKKGKLPKGLHFVNNHNGTATISGTPKLSAVGVHNLTLSAKFGKGKAKKIVTQAFTLTVA